MARPTDSRPPFKSLSDYIPEELFGGLKTPCYIIDEKQLLKNMQTLSEVEEQTGCKILLAQKAFSNYELYPLFASYLAGTEASGLYEARLGFEEMPGKEVHVFSAAYRQDEFDELLQYVDHIVFNSPSQLEKFGYQAKKSGKSIGIRINPELSTQQGNCLYDPCAPGSRLGTTRQLWDEKMTPELISLLDGIHFHTLCEQDAPDLCATLTAVSEKFGDILRNLKWINFGGGHHITRPGYHTELLKQCIQKIHERFGTQVYLEPGEACALNAGFLVTRVLDVIQNGDTQIAILDMSAACHAPDVLEMPYRPPLFGAGEPNERAFTFRLAGPTCLAGDVIGDYSFDIPLKDGDMLIFGDMAIYTTCKTNTFNGMPLPSIYLNQYGKIRPLAHFNYFDFKARLGGKL